MPTPWSMELRFAAALAVLCNLVGDCAACRPMGLMKEKCFESLTRPHENYRQLGRPN